MADPVQQPASDPQRTTGPLLALAPPPGAAGSGSSTMRRIALARLGEAVLPSDDARVLRRRLALALITADAAVVLVGLLVATLAGLAADPVGPVPVFALAAGGILGLAVAGAYRWDLVARRSKLPRFAVGALVGFVTGILAYKLAFAWITGEAPVAHFTLRAILAPFAFAAWAVGIRLLVCAWIHRWELGSLVIAVGPAEVTRRVGDLLERNHLRDRMICIDDGDPQAAATLEGLIAGRVRGIILSHGRGELSAELRLALVHARLLGVRVMSAVDLVEEIEERVPVAVVDSWWMMEVERLPGIAAPTYLVPKRLFDLAVAVPALVLLLPLFVATALAVRLTSRGPAMFTQVREGVRRQPFTIYKFRTMRLDAEAAGGAQWAQRGDPRITAIGGFLRKSRIDELPQLWNIIRGDMSIVGPRPERPEFNRQLAEQIPWYDLRHLAKPGLTGWAQVRYPYGASVEDSLAKLEYEVYYLKHASLWFDLRICLRTVAVVLGFLGR
jgi:exopolysaccharide biosynthesis polyprenyl glycosylphosphotransferase